MQEDGLKRLRERNDIDEERKGIKVLKSDASVQKDGSKRLSERNDIDEERKGIKVLKSCASVSPEVSPDVNFLLIIARELSCLPSCVVQWIALYFTFEETGVLLDVKQATEGVVAEIGESTIFWKQISLVSELRLLEQKEEKLLLEGYSQRLHFLFDQKTVDQYLGNLYQAYDIDPESVEADRIKDDFVTNAESFLQVVPEQLEIPLLEYYFNKYPEFDIVKAENPAGNSLPILLYDWDRDAMLKYVLLRFPDYKEGDQYGGISLAELRKSPPLYRQKIVKEEKEQKTVTSFSPEQLNNHLKSAQSYAKMLYQCFDKKYVQAEIKKAREESPSLCLGGIEEKILRKFQNCIPSETSEKMQQLIVIEFFTEIAPGFDIEFRESISRNRLPHLLAANGLTAALDYLQKIRLFDINDNSRTGFSVQKILDDLEAHEESSMRIGQ